MWLCLNKAFLSIVDKAKQPGCLCVRARVPGHIEAVFPSATVTRTPGNDYLFRAEVPREEVADAVSAQIAGIDYKNFKSSVKNDDLHHAYIGVWRVMAAMQPIPPYARDDRSAKLF